MFSNTALRLPRRTLGLLVVFGFAATAHAQLGPGWVPTSFTKSIHLDDDAGLQTFSWSAYRSVCSPTTCADYTYDSTNDTETFRIFDSRSNRSEIRLQNNYSSGMWQFEGYVTFDAPLHDESLFQIFGNTGSAATFLMMRGYRDNNGTIRVMGGSHTIATGVYGKEVRINIIHQYNGSAKFYVNGVFIYEKAHNDPGVVNYWKYGCYGTTSGNVPAIVQWRRVRTFKDGAPPGADVAAEPNRVTVAQGGSATSTINVSAFGGNTTLALSGVPSGVTATLSQTIVTNGHGSAALNISTTPGIATGSYSLTITATGGGTNVSKTVSVGVVPPGWKAQDVGGPGQTGGASFSNGVFTVLGGGNDIWSSADKFNFAFQEFTGNGTITVRVEAQENTNPWAKSGVMFRESTNAGSKHVGLYVTPGNGVSMQYRSTNDAPTVDLARNTGITAPHWVRLVRNANTFTGYRSADGASWSQVGAISVGMSNSALIGLAVTSHDNAVLNTTAFSNVSLPPNFVLNAVPLTQSSHSNTYQVTLTSLNGFSSSVALSANGLPSGASASFNPASISGNGSSTLTIVSSAATPAGEFDVTITGTGGGQTHSTTVPLKTSTLPPGWEHLDVGAPALAGDAGYTNATGVFVVTGAGNDIWNAADQCHFAYRAETGDLTITARVINEQLTHAYAKAGVMIRETTNGNSKSVCVVMTPTNGVALHVRSSTGATAVNPSGWNGVPLPRWVRLTRSGGTFTGYSSTDGLNWTQVATTTVSMNSNVLAGLAVTSHDVTKLNTATFDNVSLAHPDFALSASPGSRTVTAGAAASYVISVHGTNGYSGSTALVLDGLPPGVSGSLSPAIVAGSGSSTLTLTATNIMMPDECVVTVSGIGGGMLREETVTLLVNAADSDSDGIPDWWTHQHFGHATGQPGDLSLATDDADGDGMTNGKEFLCGTNPNNPASYLHVTGVQPLGNDVLVNWAAVGGKSYVVEANGASGSIGNFAAVSPAIDVTEEGETEAGFLHAGAATNGSARFYRVRLNW